MVDSIVIRQGIGTLIQVNVWPCIRYSNMAVVGAMSLRALCAR